MLIRARSNDSKYQAFTVSDRQLQAHYAVGDITSKINKFFHRLSILSAQSPAFVTTFLPNK